MNAQNVTDVLTILFTDIESSTRLWEQDQERMSRALAAHDALARAAVEAHGGTLVKMTGDGMHAVFTDPAGALDAALAMQRALVAAAPTHGVALHLRCGLHAGVTERRENDYFGSSVNRAARLTAAAHGGQMLLSNAVAELVRGRLPPEVALRDLGRVRLRDLADAEHVYQVLHPRLRQDFPPLRSLESTPNNLPKQLTSFVGRERELAEVRRLLAGTRLLTLTGPGGIGKTRLSLQAGAEAMDDYPDGVWFVELAAITDPELVPQAVASVLGVMEEAGRPVADALVTHVADRRLLLILDNCEHLVLACAELAARLLRSGSQPRILASSRENLHIAGESVYALPGLGVPDIDHGAPREAVPESEAMQLFVDRAVAAQAAFRITERNAAAIADICRHLDGIPLAIELAAARVRALPVEEIVARLTDRFRLLVRGERTAEPRQQTLRALIDWSHDLLTERERAVLRRLSVFAGGWTLAAAEAVAAGGDIAEPEVLDLLTRLIEKSLVAADPEAARYRLLETVRQYALERLASSDEDAPTRLRHLAFYLALAEEASPQLVGREQGAWLARLDLERENLLSAHAWCDRAPAGAESGLKLASAMRRYWIVRGLLGLGLRLTVEALARPGARERDLARWEALFGAGQLGGWMGRYAEARRYLEECLAIARELGDKERVASALQPLGLASLGQGHLSAARGYFEEALALARELGDRRELAAALNALAQLHRVEGELDQAEPLYRDVLALARELGDRESIAIALLNLAMVSIARGSGERVGAALREVLAIVEEIGSEPLAQSALEVGAGLAAFRGQWARAARLFGAVEAHAARTGLHRDPADQAFLAPLIAAAREALGAVEFTSVEASGRALAYQQATLEARAWLDESA